MKSPLTFFYKIHSGTVSLDKDRYLTPAPYIRSTRASHLQNPVNYKPISLTCMLCKIMEHIVASNVAQHLNKHNILYGLEHGFFFSSPEPKAHR